MAARIAAHIAASRPSKPELVLSANQIYQLRDYAPKFRMLVPDQEGIDDKSVE